MPTRSNMGIATVILCVFLVIPITALCWFILNEMFTYLRANMVATYPTTFDNTYHALSADTLFVNTWLYLPIIVLFAALLWVLMAAYREKRRETYQY